MLYQETYQSGGNPAKLNISSVVYIRSTVRQRNANEESFPAHCHSFYELNYAEYGNAAVEFDHRSLSLSPGDLTFYTPLVMHKMKNDDRPYQLLLQFSPRVVQNVFSSVLSPHRLCENFIFLHFFYTPCLIFGAKIARLHRIS